MCVQQWAGPRHSRFRSEDILALQYMMWSFLSSNATVLHRTPEFPLQVLQEAIATRDEMKVWKVLRKQRIRDELVHSTTTHKVPSDPQQHKYNVFTCVEAAVHCDTPRVILAMFRYNPADVRLATWYALYRLKTVKVSPELVDLARAQRRAWLWDRIGAFVLLRQCKMPTSRRQEGEVGALHPLAAIPDEAFRIITVHPRSLQGQRLRKMERRASRRSATSSSN
ncbi:hypothetical protein PR003_g23518 [Phytophthora rubi]|uniref:Uncharacterized protein n=1 Tax=Phytophthora rubi TaxID=129364 RepID=A0A6A3IRJ1_9STRA|nr:hypothetical protein PR002_g22991 [Phytophthora rubi]KAE8985566.1 hypothetical protein PR001_g22852 [Phytophthora rubi]KAE9297348.1 hypothetical protein PR003_g23518 [Phytophthora rubi]